jgi:hypothetical protein
MASGEQRDVVRIETSVLGGNISTIESSDAHNSDLYVHGVISVSDVCFRPPPTERDENGKITRCDVLVVLNELNDALNKLQKSVAALQGAVASIDARLTKVEYAPGGFIYEEMRREDASFLKDEDRRDVKQ